MLYAAACECVGCAVRGLLACAVLGDMRHAIVLGGACRVVWCAISCRSFGLYSNRLSGTIPSTLGSLTAVL